MPELSDLLAELTTHGIVTLPSLVSAAQLVSMQRAFAACLRHVRWNHYEGFEKTELFREHIQNVLTLDQAFLDIGLHPAITGVLRAYIGPSFQLVEARGWQSLPTRRDFHSWHADAWYDQTGMEAIPKEVKMGLYLTDVRSGAFTYVRGSHQREHPRYYDLHEVKRWPSSSVLSVTGSAGLVFLFDTSGIHRQAMPILEPRQVVFFNYHDPGLALEQENVEGYRYHPLLVNTAFLGNLSAEETRILGFGDKRNYIPAFERAEAQPLIETILRMAVALQLRRKFHLYELRLWVGRLLRHFGYRQNDAQAHPTNSYSP